MPHYIRHIATPEREDALLVVNFGRCVKGGGEFRNFAMSWGELEKQLHSLNRGGDSFAGRSGKGAAAEVSKRGRLLRAWRHTRNALVKEFEVLGRFGALRKALQ